MPTPDDAKTRAATTYNAASDAIDDQANSFWHRFGNATIERIGLAPGDRVISSGVQRARPGRKVTPESAPMSAFPSGVSRGEDGRLELPSGARPPAEGEQHSATSGVPAPASPPAPADPSHPGSPSGGS